MVIQVNQITPHWNYFLAIERDLYEISNYVEFDERNFNCFSIEIVRVLLSAGAEIDVVCKQLCHRLNATSSADNIHRYRDEINGALTHISSFKVLLPRFALTLTPWDEWSNPNGVPYWWTAYNKIKHKRNTKYHLGHLKNALHSVAGLLVMLLYLYKEHAEAGKLLPVPLMFSPEEQYRGGVTMEDHTFGIIYRL